MSPDQITLLRDSLQKLPAEMAASMFYDRLFETAPNLRRLFPDDMAQQGQKLMAMIAAAVEGLEDLESLVPIVQDLGRRHAGYGVEAEHYEIVGGALLWTLEEGLGRDFDGETKQAWRDAYGLLSSTMIQAAHSKAA